MNDELQADDCMALRFRRIARLLTRKYDAALRPSGVRSTQFILLHIIGRHPGIGINSLASATNSDPTTTTRNVLVLERNGWVTLGSSSDDHRKREIHLAETGRRAYEDAWPLWATVQKEVAAKAEDLSDARDKLGAALED